MSEQNTQEPRSVEDITALFKKQLESRARTEDQIIAEIGFVTIVEDGVAYTKELKINGKSSMVVAFANKGYIHPQALGEFVSIAASHAQAEGLVRREYPTHARLNKGSAQDPIFEDLRNIVLKVSNEQIIDHINKFGRGLLPQTDMDVYLMQFGDFQNRLPGEPGYQDVGQLEADVDKGLLSKFWVATEKPKAKKLNNWAEGYKPAIPVELQQSRTDVIEADVVEATPSIEPTTEDPT